MKKINKNSIVSGLKILSILAFSLMMTPTVALADYGVNIVYGTLDGNYYNNGNLYGNNYNYNQPLYQPPIYTPPPVPTPTVYSNSTNPNPVSTTTVYRPVARANTNTTNTGTVASTTDTNTFSGLTANAVYGAKSFLPSGLVQWVLFAIFILLLIIMIRRTLGYRENYRAIPLKHE